MPKLLANTVLYPVVRREFVVFGEEKHWNPIAQQTQIRQILGVEMVPTGKLAMDINDAKKQGFLAPILDINRPHDMDGFSLSLHREEAVELLQRVAGRK